MAADSEMRAELRERGYEPPPRGQLSAEWHELYDTISGQDPGGDDDSAEEVQPEQTPRPVPGRTRRTSPVAGLLSRGRHKGSKSGKGQPRARRPRPARRPRMPVADVVEQIWGQLAWSARPLPPVQRILSIQAPFAGAMADQSLAGSLADRVILQPLARYQDSAESLNALLGPPVFTALITLYGDAEKVTGPGGEPVIVTDDAGMPVWDDRTAMMVAGLRFSLMSMIKVAHKKADEIIEQAEHNDQLAEEADELIRWIIRPPKPGQTPADVRAEAKDRAMRFARGEPPPADSTPEWRAPPPPSQPPASTALIPAPARGAHGSAQQ